ncbi:ADP-L-glycero-D-manno-heptose 6-epimerase [Methylacidimicrobium cyclopophantes]|uniref:ADP-L-glycero-D-manno-heptose 6-epimerase n=1 Tax=Methylacidimicrobium cyclopophantes TaxID=1041766 RepID=A0A5E6MFA3_9BACT|nr:NAD-dependent epimerase/dehydratase family protein [Methylacidimicrobium cyclopophantes]VVM07667.1 ADP-L-glycero-D-manno-heptose 6-epimerase [Methylacidimicrobium cyclopophantes]
MAKDILITGGAGFLGSNLALEIQRREPGAEIVLVDDFRSGSFLNLAGFRGDLITVDVGRLDWHRLFGERSPEVVYHLASITDTTVTDTATQMRANVEGWRHLLFCLAGKSLRLVYASSAAVYGISSSGQNRVGDPERPANAYGFSKLQMEHLAKRFAGENPQISLAGLRYFNVYGPRETHKGSSASMIGQLARQMRAGKRPRLFLDGSQKRDFVYVADAIEATLAAGLVTKGEGVFNVGSGKARSFNEVVFCLNTVLGTQAEPEYFPCPYRFFQPHTEAALSATEAALGYRPRFSLEKGIEAYSASGWLGRELAQ